MKRILVGFIMDGKAGGLDRYLLNFLEAVKDQEVQIDFLTDEIHEDLKTYLKPYHSKLYAVAGLRHPFLQYRQVRAILDETSYDMVYLNVSTAIDCVAAFAAKRARVPERAIHSHSSGNDCESALQRFVYNTVHRICRLFFYRAGTHFYGCSVKAGEWIFPKKIVQSDAFEVIYNAVDAKRFCYDEQVRKEVRQELGIEEDVFAVGHIGNFCYAKNYPFLIDVFAHIHQQKEKSVLLLAGTGIELEDVKRLVREKGLSDCVKFLGWRADTERLYQAMDVFLLPSRFEGLPVVGVEAQFTKLPCVFSDTITREAKIQDHCSFLTYASGAGQWADYILEHAEYNRSEVRLTKEADLYCLSTQQTQLKRIADLGSVLKPEEQPDSER